MIVCSFSVAPTPSHSQTHTFEAFLYIMCAHNYDFSPAGEKGRRIRELTSLVQKRFGFAEGSVELYAEKVAQRGLCAIAQAESLRYKLVGGLAVRR